MDITVFEFRNNDQWRRWLSDHHDMAKEAWLLIYKKHSGNTGIRYDEALDEALCYGWIGQDEKHRRREAYDTFLPPKSTEYLVQAK